MALGLFNSLSNFIICLFHQIGCCFRPKENGLHQFRSQYKILDKIGGGGFGIVYQGYRKADRLPVAVKFVRHRQVTNWTFKRGIILPKEIILLKRCQDCQGVIRLVDWFCSKTGFIIIMERPKNFMDLFDLIKVAGRLNENVSNKIFSQIVRTIDDLYYKHSIIHRDVKDENIILDMDTGKTWLCDFGAAEFKERIKSKQFHGTRSYCPPEVFEIQRFLPLEATIWSLGILLYTMLIGHPPFENVMHICSGKIRIPGYISKECRSLIENCLQSDPEKRLRLEQLSTHEWLVKSKTDSIGEFLEMNKSWKRKKRINSMGTSRTTESDSSEECSYRASTGLKEPEPISIPMTRNCLSIESTCRRPDSGFDTCSEGPMLRQSFNGSPSLSESSSQNPFCSLCSSSYYTVDGRFYDSPRGSLISSAYFSTSSKIRQDFQEMDYLSEDGELTIMEENQKITSRKDPKKWSPAEDEELTIIEEHPKRTNRKDPRKWRKVEYDVSSDEDETMILSKNVEI